jgi:hypothetical protein
MSDVSFSGDIRPLFKDVDIQHMKPFGVMLDDYGYMSDPGDDHRNAQDVLDFLTGVKKPRMPLGGPYWSEQELALFGQWMAQGYKP